MRQLRLLEWKVKKEVQFKGKTFEIQ